MQIILLSGGSGTRLWPLSNNTRSKQFLRILEIDGKEGRESMIQRVTRQIRQSGILADITIATSENQKQLVFEQLGNDIDIVTEPSRRDTFPAICLACEYLAKEKGCTSDEVVIVMPCDPYTECDYFSVVKKMADGIATNLSDLMVMGIKPNYPSSKYGYILPGGIISEHVRSVRQFAEKPSIKDAENLISQGAVWNGGVFAFKLGYLINIAEHYVNGTTFKEILNKYENFPKISFDYEVAEKATNTGVVEYYGKWKDLGTWNTLTEELSHQEFGNVLTDDSCKNTHVINELNIPILYLGTNDLIIVASKDGILIADKNKTENIKPFAEQLNGRQH